MRKVAVILALLAAFVVPARADSLHDWACYLQSLGLRYNANAQLPGETGPTAMDCSNTARYLVQKTKGLSLPRTASDQYLYVRRHGKLKRAGGLFGGTPDTSWWTKRLEPGDLLFWEHTYNPKRKPPVTHVMVYLGTDENGVPHMAGAQNSRGVNIYKLQPRAAYGGHGGFLGLFKKRGKLVAYGRLH
ncbi:MAG: Cell wall-associated hydrolase [Verrucomicrobiota bacterium]|jgi:cell wall-associated NlpC family hydrolase